MGDQWPEWTRKRRWTVHVQCVREINRRNVPEGATGKCKVFVGDRRKGSLAEVLRQAHDVAEEHEARNVDRPKPHKVLGVAVFWTCECRYDGQRIKGWDQEGMASALVDHLMTPSHAAARREAIALDAFMDATGLFG